MYRIEVDDEVYAYLQNNASPFVDDPNSVLRRLLLLENANGANAVTDTDVGEKGIIRHGGGQNEEYVQKVLSEKFDGNFRKVGRYRMMFESHADIIYFHNFNKFNGENLWYRLNAEPLRTMRSSKKNKWICFTNPADNYGYLIPLDDIDRRVESSGWYRDDREVNIHVQESRWRELDWSLEKYEFKL